MVEDEADTRETLSAALAGEGYAVVLAPDGRAALDYLRHSEPPDVIVLDLLLPVLDGWAILEQLDEILPGRRPRVILTTGAPYIGPDWAKAHGCDGFLRKPFESATLLREVRLSLGTAEA